MRKGFVAVVFVCCITLAASAVFAFGADKFKEEMDKEEGAVKLAREVVSGGYGIITAAELQKAIKAGEDMVIVDTMPYEDSYRKGHIPQAKQFLFPIAEMKEWDSKETGGRSQEDFASLLGPDKNRKIVFYCGFVKCTRSHNGAIWAKKLGYTNVHRQPGGIYAWRGAEFQIETE